MGIDWNKKYWNALSEKDGLRPVIDPNDEVGKKNNRIHTYHHAMITEIMQQLLQREGKKMFDHVLDYGCGIGRNYELLCNMAHQYSGVDISEGMLAKAKASIDADFQLMNDHRIPHQDNQFHLFFAFWVMQHIINDNELLQTLQEGHRVLQPGGYAIIGERSAKQRTEATQDDNYINRRQPSEYIQLFKQAGFRLVAHKKLDYNKPQGLRAKWSKFNKEGENLYAFQKV